jgi:endonuclease/exonuclease/phosphatase family metal-dependent hydrolase
LYTNYDYESLKKQIDKDEYDIVVLVEFSDKHEKALKDRFQGRFPYVNRNSWSTKLAGDVVFSRYPITNLLAQYPQEPGRWKYSYFSLQREEETFYFYVVHTSAPVSLSTFKMRNEQLKKLKDDFLVQATDRQKNAPVVVLGDFNLSPWSAFYAKFEEGLEGKLRNVFRDYRPYFTRSLRDQKLLNVHIDQVFTSPDGRIGGFKVEDLPGSDHHTIIFDVEKS